MDGLCSGHKGAEERLARKSVHVDALGAQGRRVSWATNAGAARGVTAGIDDRGALLVRVDDRIERIVAGEVIWL